MGYNTARDFAAFAPSLEVALAAHFASNCFPPVPRALVGPAIEALDATVDGEHDRIIAVPQGFGSAPASEFINRLHLHAFLPDEDEEGW